MILTSNYVLNFVFNATFLYLFGMYIQSIFRTPATLMIISLGLAALITFMHHVYFIRMYTNPYNPPRTYINTRA